MFLIVELESGGPTPFAILPFNCNYMGNSWMGMGKDGIFILKFVIYFLVFEIRYHFRNISSKYYLKSLI